MSEVTGTGAAERASTPERPLGHLRVVALPGLSPLFLGKTLADLGADVIRLEPPGGDPSRALGPFRGEALDDTASLVWEAYGAGSRSVTCNLQTADGRAVFQKVVATADVLLEAEGPGGMGAVGPGFEALLALQPRLVVVSFSPFGLEGPAAGNASSDLVNLAMSGYMHMTGLPDAEPIKPSAPYQSLLHAANHGFPATLIGLRQARNTGRGVHIDLAARDTGVWMLTHTYQHYDFHQVNLARQGSSRDMGTASRVRSVFEAADGYVVWLFHTGPANAAALRSLVQRVADAGMAPPWLLEVKWEEVDLRTAVAGLREQFDEVFRAYFKTQKKADLFAWALEQRVMLGPVQTLEDLIEDPQLSSRNAWAPAFGGEGVAIPAKGVYMSEGAWRPRSPSPAPGQHTREVLGGEFGFDDASLQLLHATGSV